MRNVGELSNSCQGVGEHKLPSSERPLFSLTICYTLECILVITMII